MCRASVVPWSPLSSRCKICNVEHLSNLVRTVKHKHDDHYLNVFYPCGIDFPDVTVMLNAGSCRISRLICEPWSSEALATCKHDEMTVTVFTDREQLDGGGAGGKEGEETKKKLITLGEYYIKNKNKCESHRPMFKAIINESNKHANKFFPVYYIIGSHLGNFYGKGARVLLPIVIVQETGRDAYERSVTVSVTSGVLLRIKYGLQHRRSLDDGTCGVSRPWGRWCWGSLVVSVLFSSMLGSACGVQEYKSASNAVIQTNKPP